ncbi:cytochrome P450 family protein [Micromonospora sp. CA-248089]|uniref:cytochrome P450 family protein n=1 Tax=Micromonospora sp. CA-248089 TaxID=3239960 RepID=UPI003D92C871
MSLSVSLADPAFLDDPVGGYHRLRDQAPLVRIGMPGGPPVWLVTRYEEVKRALSDPRLVVDHGNVPGHQGLSVVEQIMQAYGMPSEFWDYAANMTFMDGADHNRLRRLIVPVFARRRITEMTPRVEQISRRLLDRLAAAGGGDLIDDYSSPLTSTVICDLIGIDEADQPAMRRWMHEYTEGRYAEAAFQMVDYTKSLIARRRAEPAGDMVSMLLHASTTTDDRLSEVEIVAMTLLMVNNGHLSTSHFIPNALLVLFDNPDQLARLRNEPALLPRALHELMRVTSPAQIATPRYATEDLEIGGVLVRRGEAVTGSLMSANFDPRVFPDPLRVDITRDPGRLENHIAFGAGPHYCTGAALGRLEGETALRHLLLENLSPELAVGREQLQWEDVALAVRLLKALPVHLSHAV